MGKRFSRKTTSKRTIKLSPKEAQEIIRQEFTDSHNNKHIFIMDVKPHLPNKPTINGTVEYKEDK